MHNRRQLILFLVLLFVNAFCAFAVYAFFTDQLVATIGVPMPDLGVSLADLSPVLPIETFLLNGIIGLVAGQNYMRDGLVAAAGVHFWNDVVFHIIYGLF